MRLIAGIVFAGGIVASGGAGEQDPPAEFRGRFLALCDLAAIEMNKPITPFGDRENADPATHHMPFFEDAHAVRALAVAYDITGRRKYLDACCLWSDRMIDRDFRQVKPITFPQRPSGIIFYCLELYVTGLEYWEPRNAPFDRAASQIDLALAWMAAHQKSRGAPGPGYLDRNTDMAGLPYLMDVLAGQLPRYRGLMAAADGELRYIGQLLFGSGRPNPSRLLVWEVMTWGMLSHAERLGPGALRRSSASERRGHDLRLPGGGKATGSG